ncbi:glycosyltransferase [Myroides albus]|uniref:Glycosyltransferase n=1 Tax=Myroides albus TaxID=2562892 RepID=A0A6I3LSF9_9FLAO|nr:glycosyltransferase [Myroides albus]MTG99032.1 glycosyltransferase [Myroides albus]UVD80441.1 glycosyltransferase [Myroides albus]
MLTLLFYCFIAITVIELIYYFAINSNVAFHSTLKDKKSHISEPVSVIVYVKNQEQKLPEFLELLKAQDFSPGYEIILVNNASEDESLEILEDFALKNANAKLVDVVNNETFWGNKKYALTLGIKVAKFEHLLFVEPAACPMTPNWIFSMSRGLSTQKNLVIGFTQIANKRRSFINKLIRYQNVQKTTNLFSWSGAGKPLYGNAYNQAYNKSLFYKVNGFISHMKIPFSDEYTFINQIGTSTNTSVSFSPDSFTIIESKNTISEWKNAIKKQDLLLRKLSVWAQLKIRFFNLNKLLFYIAFTLLISFLYQWEIVLGVFLFRCIIAHIFSGKTFSKFGTKELVWTLPLLEIIHIFISTYYSFTHFITRQKIEKKYY